MDISTTSAIERVARVLAGQRFSANANGDQSSAAASIDASWQDYRADAVAVLKTLREPDQAMAGAGDAKIWEAMIMAGLRGAGKRAAARR